MLHDYMQYTYLAPAVLVCAGIVMLIVFFIKNSKNQDVTKLRNLSGYAYWLLAIWAFILFTLLMVEEIFRGKKFNEDVFKACWPMLLSLLIVSLLAFIRKYRKHPGGLLLSCAILVSGFYLFIKVLDNLAA